MTNVNYAELNEDAFDFLAERYAQRENKSNSFNLLVEEFSRHLIDNFQNPHILEIGCGSGFMLRYFSERGLKITAIDISSKIISVAKMKSSNTHYIHSDFLSYNFCNRKFSGVFASNILHLFPASEIKKVFDKIYSLSEERGVLYFSIPLFDKFGEEIVRRGEEGNSVLEFRVKHTKESIASVLRNSRFKTIEKTVTEFEDSKRNHLSRLNVLLTK